VRDGQALAAMESDVKSGGGRAVVRGGEGNAWRRLMNLVMQLRKVGALVCFLEGGDG
jgi:hypothetical protein